MRKGKNIAAVEQIYVDFAAKSLEKVFKFPQ